MIYLCQYILSFDAGSRSPYIDIHNERTIP